ncbi:MAG: hypothetical protein VKO44_06985 [Cyanobacteriota bacterium]|nr:hypothetical protein [Cyanobacteriota bacterium]
MSMESDNASAILGVKLRVACLCLFIVYIISVVIGALPVRILNPGWYLSLNNLFISNGPILIVALLAGSLALFLDPDSKHNQDLGAPLAWTARVAFQCFLLVVVSQLIAGVAFSLELTSQQQTQRQALLQQQANIRKEISGLTAASQLPPGLQAIQGSAARSSTPPSLAEQKQTILRTLEAQRLGSEKQLAQQLRQRLLALVTDSVRILVSAVVLAAACRAFARWSP